MKKNNCWFYGDSFTQSLAVKRNSRFFSHIGIKEESLSWTIFLSNELNLNEMVNAMGGRSSQHIFMSALYDVHKFKKGDWIILTSAPYVRIEGINFKDKNVSTYNNEQILFGRFDLGEIYNGGSHGVPIPGSKSKILFDYVTEFILPFEDEWRNYWKYNLIKLAETFRLMGYKCIYWDYSLWSKFKSISKETNGELKDDHWGIEGNKEFFNFLMENINNNKYTLE